MKILSTIKGELLELLRIASVTSFTQFLIILPNLASVPVAGLINDESLNAAGMGFTIVNFSGYSVILGLSMASETLFSQVSGSTNRSSLGIIVQRGLIIKILAVLLITSVLLHTDSLLILIGQYHKLAQMTHQFILGILPGYALAFPVLITEIKYLQAQKMVKPCLLGGFIANILNIGYTCGLVFGLNLGVLGCGLCISLTFLSWVVILLVYFRVSRVYSETWSGFNLDALRYWKTFLKYGLPGIAMVEIEMICFEVYTILAGFLGHIQLSCHILNIIVHFCLNISYGIGTASAVQVGNSLGGGHCGNAKTAAILSIIIAVCVALLISPIILATHNYIPYLFTNEPEVILKVQSMLFILCAELPFDIIMTVEAGILRAQGKQYFGAISNIICLGLLSIPFAVYLMFWAHLGVLGCWIAIACGVFFQTVVYSLKIYFTNWEKESLQAQTNAGAEQELPGTNSQDNISLTKIKEQTSFIEKSERTPINKKYMDISNKRSIIFRSLQICLIVLICVSSGISSTYLSKNRRYLYDKCTNGI